jgi:AmiR/NasT family two-component response regulator
VDAIKERQLFQTGDLTAEARREDQLERKADSRDLIGRAKGILMARSNVDDQRAFDMLRRASQRLNIKLVEVAERVAHPGDAGGPPPEPSL